MRHYIGIDPGKSGGIAILTEDMKLILFTVPTIGKLVDHQSIRTVLDGYRGGNGNQSYYALEDVHSLPGVSAKANFSFGENKGEYRGLLVGLQLPYMEVQPKTWQKIAWEGVPLMKKPNGKTDTKAVSLTAAKRLFPNESFLATSRSSVPHDGLVDATLIAYYLKCKMG
jgi:hypothetical protein